ncbi:TPA: hypothetical protein HA231_05135 [Candidatus Woesearchaeota archaeon]|nr:hypothetical protein [Candidatus Woesearchaeota archaeon]
MIYLLGSSRQTTKERVVEILGEFWPLTARKLYLKLKKRYGFMSTYQAAYRAVTELLTQDVLVKEGKNYSLSPEWIERMVNVTDSLLDKYTQAGRINPSVSLQKLTFQSIGDAWDFIISKASSGFFGTSSHCYLQVPRLFPVPLSDSQKAVMAQFLQKTKTTVFCRRKGPLEKLVSNYLSHLGASVHIGVSCAQPTNSLIIGTSVVSMHVLYTETDYARLSTLYNSIKNILSVNIFKKFSSIMQEKRRVVITINRIPEIFADVLRENERLLRTVSRSQARNS